MTKINENIVKNIRHLDSQGCSYSSIAKSVGLGKSTVGRLLKNKSVSPAKKTGGRPIMVPNRTSHHINRLFLNGTLRTATDGINFLSAASNIFVSKNTIRSILMKSGLKCYAKVKKPRLLPRHKLERRRFARRHKNTDQTFWNNVIFTDESKFNLFGPDGYKHVWRLPKCVLQDHHIREVVKFGGGSVMVWGAITYDGVGELLFIDGRMNAEQFIDVLSSGFGKTLSKFNYNLDDVILQQDNDAKHRARITREWIHEAEISVLPWPSQSPDMNIIEHVWNDVNVRIRARRVKPQNKAELMAAIKEEWEATPLGYIRNLYHSMSRRIKALSDAKGGATKY